MQVGQFNMDKARVGKDCIFLSSPFGNNPPDITDFIKVRGKSKGAAAKYMTYKEMKEKILQNWKLDHIKITRNLVSSACDYQKYCCDVFNGVRKGEYAKVKTEVKVDLNGHNEYLNLNLRDDLSTCKKLFGTFENFVSNCEDIRVFELLAIADGGKYRIDGFKDFPKSMNVLFFSVGAYFFVEQIWDFI